MSRTPAPHTTFALITDTHWVAPGRLVEHVMWNKLLVTDGGELGELLVQALNSHKLDYVIHCGDLTHLGDPESFEFARAMLGRVRAPILFTLGNRDVGHEGIRRNLAKQWSLSREIFYFVTRINDVRYIFLDSNYAHLPSGDESEVMHWDRTHEYAGVGFSSAQLEWLERELESDRKTTTLVFAHHPIASKSEYPIISPRDLGEPHVRLGPVWQKLFPKFHREVLALLERAPNVKVMFTGHWHINDIVRVNNLYHVKTASLIEYPFEYRIVTVSDDYLDITTHRLSAESLVERSLVPEWHNQWIQGESFDRARRIYFDDELIKTRV